MISEVPGEIPETTPLLFIVATEVVALLQFPPAVAFANVVPDPGQTLVFPVITATAGSGFTVNDAALVPVPDGVVTLIVPVVALFGKVAVICVALFTVKVVAAVPLKFTAVAPVKLVPVITTDAPELTHALFGLKPVTVGATV